MSKGKVLIMIRVSTEAQQVEDQHNEMLEFCKREGYEEKDMIWIEDKGASAIKLNDAYQLMISQVKENIENNNDIKCFAVYELSRAFRNEGVYYEIKQFLLAHNVQFIIRTPYLRLLNEDGTLNAGMELAMSLFATLAQQEMSLKKDRFKRAKKGYSQKGKFSGGWCCKYGYRINDEGYVVPDEEDAAMVQKIFELYSTGLYSTDSLSEELKSRGYAPKFNNVKAGNEKLKTVSFEPGLLIRILHDTAYIGRTDNNHDQSHRNYPPIISQGLWEKVEGIRKRNFLFLPRTTNPPLALKIMICPECGRPLYCDGIHYCCHKHKKRYKYACDYDVATRIDVADKVVWLTAAKIENSENNFPDKKKRQAADNQLQVLLEKKKTLQSKLENHDAKKKKIVDAYLDDLISLEERNRRLDVLADTLAKCTDQLNTINENISALHTALTNSTKPIQYPLEASALDQTRIPDYRAIIKKHIKSCIVTRLSFGHQDPRSKKPNSLHIVISTYLFGEVHYLYFPRKYENHDIYYYDQEKQAILDPLI